MGSPANRIKLEQVSNGDTKIFIQDSEWGLPVFMDRLFVIDTCVLLPTLLPKHRRKANTLFEFSKRLDRNYSKSHRNKINLYKNMRQNINQIKKRIKLVNLLEKGKYKEKGMYFVITDAVFQELRTHEGKLKENNVTNWCAHTSVKNYSYQLSINISLMRSKYTHISKMFDESGDFSLAITSYILGIDVVTCDYRSFKKPIRKRFQDMFDNRWKGGRSFEFQDVDSFLMLLKDRRHRAHVNYQTRKAEATTNPLDQVIAQDSIPERA